MKYPDNTILKYLFNSSDSAGSSDKTYECVEKVNNTF